MATVEVFEYLGQAYFHQDYKEEHGSPTQTVRDFAMENPLDTVRALHKELSAKLNAGLVEGDAQVLWLNDFHAMYDPAYDNLTYVGWLQTVDDLVKAAIDQRSTLNAV